MRGFGYAAGCLVSPDEREQCHCSAQETLDKVEGRRPTRVCTVCLPDARTAQTLHSTIYYLFSTSGSHTHCTVPYRTVPYYYIFIRTGSFPLFTNREAQHDPVLCLYTIYATLTVCCAVSAHVAARGSQSTLFTNGIACTILPPPSRPAANMLTLLLRLLPLKLLSLVVTDYIFYYLCTGYLDSLLEFVHAYINIVDLVREHNTN